jgi:hypothetical protein
MRPITSIPGHAQWAVDRLGAEVTELAALGLPAVLLFGLPAANFTPIRTLVKLTGDPGRCAPSLKSPTIALCPNGYTCPTTAPILGPTSSRRNHIGLPGYPTELQTPAPPRQGGAVLMSFDEPDRSIQHGTGSHPVRRLSPILWVKTH